MRAGRRRRPAIRVVATAIAALCASSAAGSVVSEPFASGAPSFEPERVDPTARVVESLRTAADGAEDGRVERLRFATARGGAAVPLVLGRPPSRVFEEFAAEVRFRGDVSAVVFGLRVRFPGLSDPRTGSPLETVLRGPVVTPTGRWQTHRVAASGGLIRDALRRLRFVAADPAAVDEASMVVDGFVAEATLSVGESFLEFDGLNYGPVVAPHRELIPALTEESAVEPAGRVAAAAEPARTPERRPLADLRLGQLRVAGVPFFPRVAPIHRGDAAAFAATGCNVALVADATDRAAVGPLVAAGLFVTAEPPDGPVDAATPDELLFWSLGPRVRGAELGRLEGELERLRRDDPVFGRPVLIDVVGEERACSRLADLLSTSRHISHTAFGYDEYRDWLEARRAAGRPGNFFFTWVQTDAAASDAGRRLAAGRRPPVVEPEQIRAQVYAALSAGTRGVGFWRHDRAGDPAAVERDLAISLLNRELALLEPWLATAEVRGREPISPAARRPGTTGRRVRPRGGAGELLASVGVARGPWAETRPDAGRAELTILGSGEDRVALACWYGDAMQFVPGQLAATDVPLVIPGVPESATVWHVSLAGVRSLAREWVPGGVRVTLPRFDRTAVLLISADRERVDRLKRRVAEGLPEAATVSVRLARAKQRRVERTFAELARLRAAQPDGPQLLAKADDAALAAESALGRGDYAEAIHLADTARQYLRVLQRADWDDAVRLLPQPLASPHALAHDTLPDHWRLIAAVGRSGPVDPGAENRLASGTFDSASVMSAEGWEHRQDARTGVRAAAAIQPGGTDGGMILRLSAERVAAASTSPETIENASVTVRSPPVTLAAGQIVHATGLVRVGRPLAGHPDGLTIHESIGGPAQALRWTKPGDWQRFELFREAVEPGPWQITVALHGTGEVALDDLRVVTLDPARPVAVVRPAKPAPPRTIFPRLPGWTDPRSLGLWPRERTARPPGRAAEGG